MNRKRSSSEEASGSSRRPRAVVVPHTASVPQLAEYVRPVPLILVAAKIKNGTTHASVNTDIRAVNRYANRRGFLWASSSTSDRYDKAEPLTTKTTKIYKKRLPHHPAAVASDDSILAVLPTPGVTQAKRSVMFSDTTDLPESDHSKINVESKSSSDAFSSSGTIIESDDLSFRSNDFPDRPLFDNLKLSAGLAFIYMSIPPDGGYGWLVVAFSFISQLIVEGIIFSIGILLPYMAEDFQIPNGQVVLVASIQVGCYYMGNVFSTALINRYGFRPVTMLGVCISSLAIFVASFSPSLVMMVIFYSVIGGPGLSMINVSAQLIVGFYFERYRPLVSGLAFSGCGAGMVIFSITNNIMVHSIGWQNTIRCHAGIVFIIIFMAIGFREVKPSPVGLVRQSQVSSSSSNEYYGNFYVHNFLAYSEENATVEFHEPPKKTCKEKCRRFWCACCIARERNRVRAQRESKKYVVHSEPLAREDLFYTGRPTYEEPHRKEHFDGKSVELLGTDDHLQRAAYRLKNIHYSDSDMSELETPKISPITSKTNQRSTGIKKIRQSIKREVKKRCWYNSKFRRALHRLLDFHLFKTLEFRVLLAAAFLYPMGFNIPFLYSKMRTKIALSQAQMIGPIIGSANFMTRALSGVVAFKLSNWTLFICGGGMVLGGGMVFLSSLIGSEWFWFQVIYAICFGVGSGVFATLRGLIYVKYLGLSKLTNTIGMTGLAMGLGVFIGTTFGGILVELTNAYMASFMFAGVCMMVAGLLKLMLPMIEKISLLRSTSPV